MHLHEVILGQNELEKCASSAVWSWFWGQLVVHKWCFPGNLFHMRNTDEHSGVSEVEISIWEMMHRLQGLVMQN